jgi:hypothetical protein
MSSGMKPDDKIVDVRPKQRKRRESSVNAWKQVDEHSGLLLVEDHEATSRVM